MLSDRRSRVAGGSASDPRPGQSSETKWLPYAHEHLRGLFAYIPQQSGYTKHIRAAFALMQTALVTLANDTETWTDVLRLLDGTPVPCGRSRETVKRADLAGHAGYGYCASHNEFFWGMR